MGNKGTQFSLSCCEGRLDPYVALHHCWWSSLLPALYRSHKILQVAISFISVFLPFFFYSSHISGGFQGFKLLSTSISFNLWNLPEKANPKLENYQDSCRVVTVCIWVIQAYMDQFWKKTDPWTFWTFWGWYPFSRVNIVSGI